MVSDKQLDIAVNKVLNGELSVRIASALYCVPKSTLSDRCLGKHSKKEGRQQVIDEPEEKILVDRILVLAKWGFPLNCTDLKHLVKSSLDRQGLKIDTFRENLPGDKWCRMSKKKTP